MSLQPFFKQHWPWIAWLAGIFILTGMPGDYVPRVRRLEDWIEYDKAAHFLLFFVLVFLALRSFITQYETNYQRVLYVAVLLVAIAIGGVTELLQEYVFTGRQGNLYDFGADALGCFSGMFLFDFMQKKNKTNPGETKNY
jgi:VanZ family protein